MARKNEKTESGKERFVAVRKNNEGNLCEFKSNTGKVYDLSLIHICWPSNPSCA